MCNIIAVEKVLIHLSNCHKFLFYMYVCICHISALTEEEIFVNRASLSSIKFYNVCVYITNNSDNTNELLCNYLNDER